MDRVLVRSRLIVAVLLAATFGLMSVRADSPDKGSATNTKKQIKKEDFRYDGKPFSYWQSYWKTELKAERRIDALWAMAAFGSRGYAREAVEVILEMLNEVSTESLASLEKPSTEKPSTPDEKITEAIPRALEKMGADAAAILFEHLDNEKILFLSARVYSPHSDQRAGRIGASAVPVLIEKIHAKREETSWLAASILSCYLNEEAIANSFREEMKDQRKARALGRALAAFNPVIGAESAVKILARIGPEARPALPLLVRASLGDEKSEAYGELCRTAKRALKDLKPTSEELVSALAQAIDDPEATKKLIELGQPARAAIPALLKAANAAVRDREYDRSEARLAQIDALEKLGAEKKDILGAIQRLLMSTESGSFRQQALKRFLRLDEDPASIVAVLRKVLERERPLIILVSVAESEMAFDHEAIIALGKQGAAARSAVPVLLKTYENRNDDTRKLVIQTLGQIGPDAKTALPLLNQVLQGQNAELRRAAAQAIEAITQRKPEK